MKWIVSFASKIAPKVIFPIVALMILAMAIQLPDPRAWKFWEILPPLLTFFAILIAGFIIGTYYGSELSSKK